MPYTPILSRTSLAAEGAWTDDADAATLPRALPRRTDGSTELNLLATYWKGSGSTDGRLKLRVFWTVASSQDGTEVEVPDTALDAAGVASGDELTGSHYRFVYDLPSTTSGNPTAVLVELRVPRDVVKIRVEGAEAGDTDHPGDFALALEGSL